MQVIFINLIVWDSLQIVLLFIQFPITCTCISEFGKLFSKFQIYYLWLNFIQFWEFGNRCGTYGALDGNPIWIWELQPPFPVPGPVQNRPGPEMLSLTSPNLQLYDEFNVSGFHQLECCTFNFIQCTHCTMTLAMYTLDRIVNLYRADSYIFNLPGLHSHICS